jgi:hypothetical protein
MTPVSPEKTSLAFSRSCTTAEQASAWASAFGARSGAINNPNVPAAHSDTYRNTHFLYVDFIVPDMLLLNYMECDTRSLIIRIPHIYIKIGRGKGLLEN